LVDSVEITFEFGCWSAGRRETYFVKQNKIKNRQILLLCFQEGVISAPSMSVYSSRITKLK
jgi:hypothetical protein